MEFDASRGTQIFPCIQINVEINIDWVIANMTPHHPEYFGIYFLQASIHSAFSYIIQRRKKGFRCLYGCPCHHRNADPWLELALGHSHKAIRKKRREKKNRSSSLSQANRTGAPGSRPPVRKTGSSQRFSCLYNSLIWSTLGSKLGHEGVGGGRQLTATLLLFFLFHFPL